MAMSVRSRLSLPLVMVFAASCMDLSTGPGTESPDLELTLAEFNTVNDAFGPAFLAAMTGWIMPIPSITGPASACPLDSASALFTCAKVGWGGAPDYTTAMLRSYQLLSAGGLPLTAYDKEKVAAVRLIQDKETTGSFQNNGKLTTVVDTVHNDFTMSGLLVAPRVINGNGTSKAVYTDTGVTQIAVSTYTMANVVMPLRTPGNFFFDWPASGVVTFSVAVSGSAVVTDTVTVQVTFTGDNKASYTKTHAGVTQGVCWWTPGTTQASGGCNQTNP